MARQYVLLAKVHQPHTQYTYFIHKGVNVQCTYKNNKKICTTYGISYVRSTRDVRNYSSVHSIHYSSVHVQEDVRFFFRAFSNRTTIVQYIAGLRNVIALVECWLKSAWILLMYDLPFNFKLKQKKNWALQRQTKWTKIRLLQNNKVMMTNVQKSMDKSPHY